MRIKKPKTKPTTDEQFRSFIRAAQRLRERTALAEGKLHEVRVVAYIHMGTGKINVLGGENLHEEWVVAFATQMRKFDLNQDITDFNTVRGLAGHKAAAKVVEWLLSLKTKWNQTTKDGLQGSIHLGDGKWASLESDKALKRWLYGNWVHDELEHSTTLDQLGAYHGMMAWDAAKALQVLAQRVECILKLELFLAALLGGTAPNLEEIEAMWHQGIVAPPNKLWDYLWLSTPDYAAAILRGEQPTSNPFEEHMKSLESSPPDQSASEIPPLLEHTEQKEPDV